MTSSQNSGASAPFPQPLAVSLLLLVATLFAANHVGARLAFDDGVSVPVAIFARTVSALTIILALMAWQRQALTVPASQRGWVILLGGMIGGQSLLLYAAIARLPVAITLLIMHTWPIAYALMNWVLNGMRPSRAMVIIIAIVVCGMVLVLDIPSWVGGAANGDIQWLPWVALPLLAAVFFALALWITENRLIGMAGTVRSAFTMITVLGMIIGGSALGVMPGAISGPSTAQGWIGLALLMACYSVAFTSMFVLVQRLDMARNGPVANFETVAALLLGYIILGQSLAPLQLMGGALIFACIIWLGLSPTRRPVR